MNTANPSRIQTLCGVAAVALCATWYLERTTRAGVEVLAAQTVRSTGSERPRRSTAHLDELEYEARPARSERPARCAIFSLTVVDADERTPVTGVRVFATRVSRDEVGTRAPLRTDSQGTATLELEPGTDWWMTLEASGRAGHAFLLPALEAGERRAATLELPALGSGPAVSEDSAPWFGRVVDRHTRRPVPGTTIVRGESVVSTDAEGQFRLEGGGHAFVHARGYVPMRVELTRKRGARRRTIGLAHEAELIVEAEPGALIHASVAPQHLVLDGEGTMLPAALEWSARCGANGACTITGLPPDVPLWIESSSGTVRKHVVAGHAEAGSATHSAAEITRSH